VPYGDVIVPFVMAASGLAALQQRRETGKGAHIDASMYEICVQQMHGSILQSQQGNPPLRSGNSDPSVFQQDVYPAAGEDRWVAISLANADQQKQLETLAGSTDIAAWTADFADYDLVTRLQGAGIAAGVVQDIEDLIENDPALAARSALVELKHPLLGNFGHMRTPVSFSRHQPRPFRAPGMGEHSEHIASTIAGLSGETIKSLKDAGVFE
jgi:crotonobetainyl-CoA:carnitine CoA-transferase CaiB-like acyl-CoA transferase